LAQQAKQIPEHVVRKIKAGKDQSKLKQKYSDENKYYTALEREKSFKA
jgi:hypothetical protein